MMKKIYVGAFALMVGFHLTAQHTIDFESTVLPSNSVNNGSDLSGGFTYDGFHFTNFYDTTYQFNIGFAISNQTDSTTPGWANSFSSITGSGFNSSNYAVFYPDGKIEIDTFPILLHTMRITNTTYAALSMRNGDFVGKKFGSIYNANGDVDGTNGEDFFKLNIHSLKANGDTIQSMEVYLADFRFADSAQDFILEDWMEVDLSQLHFGTEVIDALAFDFESSDMGMFGINTPTYFALDDFTYIFGIADVKQLKKNIISVFPNPAQDHILLQGISGKVKIENCRGENIFTSTDSTLPIEIQDFESGIYFVTVSNSEGTFTSKFIKL